jgi:FtsP/CotA-like multicopper oxidase with cupredoxin domain
MSRKGLSRRKFMAVASLGVAGACINIQTGLARAMMGSGGGGMGGGGTGGGTIIINPPPGAPFRDPVEAVKNSLGVYELAVQEAQVNLNGTWATLLTYNGQFPGPTIRARKGETLRVQVKNFLPYTSDKNILGHTKNVTNLHTHGLHVSPNAPADSMMVQLRPGEIYDYSYDLGKEEPGHLNFYHPHVHGVVAEQYWGGLAGPLVIEDETAALAGYETHIMVLKDLTLSGSVPEPYTSTMEYMNGKEGNLVLVNGQVNPVLNIQPGQVQRWRIVNASNARFYKLSLENHSLYLVGTDGGLLDRPYQLSSLLLAPGERADILVRANQASKSYRFLSLPYSRGGMSGQQQVTLLTLAYGGTRVSGVLPAVVNPDAKRIAIDTAVLPRRTLTLSMMQMRGYINGVSFADMDHTYKFMSHTGTYEVWEIVNQSGMDHPFHQHVNSAQVLSITGGDSGYASLYTSIPAWKDVVIVPKSGSVTLLVPVMDWPGMTMFHCHIIEHEDIGMMGVWDIMEMPM